MNKQFTQLNIDAIKEVINMGIGEAAFSLSELLNKKVGIKVSELFFLSNIENSTEFKNITDKISIYIHQQFEGSLGGQAILSYSSKNAINLMNVLLEKSKKPSDLTNVELSALEEFGNIILGSCISKIGDVLGTPIRFKIPKVSVLEKEINYLALRSKFSNCILVKSSMKIDQDNVKADIYMLLEFTDFIELIEEITKLFINRTTDNE